MLPRLSRVLVDGPSMEPVLRSGDHLVVRRGAPVLPGDLVLARFRDRPDVLVVKRAVHPQDGGWRLASDNQGPVGAVHGLGDVEAVVLLRYWPWPPLVAWSRRSA